MSVERHPFRPIRSIVGRTDFCRDCGLDRGAHDPNVVAHTPWCPAQGGHEGDCWQANNDALGIKPGPALTITRVER